jgi:hypothetical protein
MQIDFVRVKLTMPARFYLYIYIYSVRLYTCIVENDKCGWAFIHIVHINNKKRPSTDVKFQFK